MSPSHTIRICGVCGVQPIVAPLPSTLTRLSTIAHTSTMRRLAGESSTPESHPADSRMATHYTYRQNLYVAQQQQQQPPAPIPPQWQTSPIPARETHPKDRSRSPTKGSLQITKRMRRMQAETSEMRRSQANMREMRRKGDDSSLSVQQQ